MTFQLVCIEPKELTQYKSDMQEAFQKGFEDAFGKTDAVILPEKEIDQSVNAEGSAVYKAVVDGEMVGLDPIVTGEFYDLIRKINQESNIAVVMVSHDIETAVENASHILHLQETVRFFGTAEDYRKSRIGKKFLGGEEHD